MSDVGTLEDLLRDFEVVGNLNLGPNVVLMADPNVSAMQIGKLGSVVGAPTTFVRYPKAKAIQICEAWTRLANKYTVPLPCAMEPVLMTDPLPLIQADVKNNPKLTVVQDATIRFLNAAKGQGARSSSWDATRIGSVVALVGIVGGIFYFIRRQHRLAAKQFPVSGDDQLPLPMDLGPERKASIPASNTDFEGLWATAGDALQLWAQARESGDVAERKKRYAQWKAIVTEIHERFPKQPQPDWYKKLEAKVNKPKQTYAQAQGAILNDLTTSGWAVTPGLKIPHATSPDGSLRLWFKPQAVWATRVKSGERHAYKDARTISYDLDIRRYDAPRFREWITKRYLTRRSTPRSAA